MLRLAREEGLIESAPVVKLHKGEKARERVLSEEEYQTLLAVSPLHKAVVLASPPQKMVG